MKTIISFILILAVIFTISIFAIVKEDNDSKKLHRKFKSVENNEDALVYLNYISTQPIWRISLLSTFIGGLIFYVIYGIMLDKGFLSKDLFLVTILVSLILYLMINGTLNYFQFHNICPAGCAEKLCPN